MASINKTAHVYILSHVATVKTLDPVYFLSRYYQMVEAITFNFLICKA